MGVFARRLALLLVAAGATLLCGCHSISYYSQAVSGQWELLIKPEPIRQIIADPKTPEPLRERLQLVLRLREFAARELALPTNGHYLNYADLKRPYVAWTVYAAPEFSTKAKSWWYPIVGSLDYHGYFKEAAARRYAESLRQRGFDVFVGAAPAFSTLGWFQDPVLNTFVFDEEADLAELLFHELAHQRVFVAGDTEFNEAFATAVAEEGLKRWMQTKNDPAGHERYRASIAREEQFVQLVIDTREKLEKFFEAKNHPPRLVSELRAGKQAIFEEMREKYLRLKQSWGGDTGYDRWFAKPLNNAQLNTVEAYYKLVPSFERLLAKHHGDLPAFYREVKSIGRLKKDERRERLR
jgi:predicted aminopeptidase